MKCIHRGEIKRRERSDLCSLKNRPHVPAYGCEKFGECTETRQFRSIKAVCRSCGSYEVPAVNLHDTFDRVYCINLDRRPDRWEAFLEQVPADWPFRAIQRVSAVDGKRVITPPWWRSGAGAWGCYRTHLNLIEAAVAANQSVLLLEDDAVFGPDFTERCRAFFGSLPRNWGMVYLGGQVLNARKQPPQQINPHVYRAFNLNRTHAFGLRGVTLRQVYRHLCDDKWKKGHHIDHHLGRFHRTDRNTFCPARWLVGQREGDSDISGKQFRTDRFYPNPQALAKLPPPPKPKPAPTFVAVVGLHSSGSSALAGCLWHLGVFLGSSLTGYYGREPGKRCGYEASGLAQLVSKAIPFPACNYGQPLRKTQKSLQRWIWRVRQNQKIAGGKHPLLCRLGEQLTAAAGPGLKVIHINRPLESSIESLIRREPKRDPEKLAHHQRWLWGGKQKFLRQHPDALTVEYADLLDNPDAVCRRMAQYLDIKPAGHQFKSAAASIKPELQHV